MTDKIDVVYLWVDGSDKKWLEKHKFYKSSGTQSLSENAITEGRFRNNDELKYSLRSIEKYAPWVNKVYIVTDNQVPSWLNESYSKVEVIDHKKIIPDEYLPTFNSMVLTTYIDNIPELSEKFIYFSDDYFLGRKVSPEHFFSKQNYPKFVMRKSHRKNKAWFMNKFVNLKKDIPYLRRIHTPTPFLKSEIKKIKELFNKEIVHASGFRFRHPECFNRIIYNMFMLNENKASVYIQRRHPSLWMLKILHYLGIKEFVHLEAHSKASSEMTKKQQKVQFNKNKKLLQYIKKFKPYSFNLNDGESSNPETRDMYLEFLNEIFPNKSLFEI